MLTVPRIDDALGSLSDNSYFSALDAASGYWQVPMASMEDREKPHFVHFVVTTNLHVWRSGW